MTTETQRLFIANHESALGAALMHLVDNPLASHLEVVTSTGLDWCCTTAVANFLRSERPTQVILPIGGPAWRDTAPQRPERALQQCMFGGMNLIEQAQQTGIPRLLVVGSACTYPCGMPAPLAEEDLLTGRFNPACEAEGITTIALLKLCETITNDAGGGEGRSYRGMLTATPFDHVPGAAMEECNAVTTMMQLLHQARVCGAREVLLPYAEQDREEFLYASDVAAAALFVLGLSSRAYNAATSPSRRFLNAGYGSDIDYGTLARKIAEITGYTGAIVFAERTSRQAASPRYLDNHRLRSLGWEPLLDLDDALALKYFHCVMQQPPPTSDVPMPLQVRDQPQPLHKRATL
jgi:nucleoside-diphosphate-sugar epimerase